MKKINSYRKRIRNNKPINKNGEYVLYWMQINRRFEYNFALEYAVAWANKLNKPLLIYEDLTRACRFSHGVRSLNVGLASMFRTFLV